MCYVQISSLCIATFRSLIRSNRPDRLWSGSRLDVAVSGISTCGVRKWKDERNFVWLGWGSHASSGNVKQHDAACCILLSEPRFVEFDNMGSDMKGQHEFVMSMLYCGRIKFYSVLFSKCPGRNLYVQNIVLCRISTMRCAPRGYFDERPFQYSERKESTLYGNDKLAEAWQCSRAAVRLMRHKRTCPWCWLWVGRGVTSNLFLDFLVHSSAVLRSITVRSQMLWIVQEMVSTAQSGGLLLKARGSPSHISIHYWISRMPCRMLRVVQGTRSRHEAQFLQVEPVAQKGTAQSGHSMPCCVRDIHSHSTMGRR